MKSLKEQNNWKVWLFVAINSLFFYSILVSGKIQLSGLKEAIVDASTLLPAGIAGVIATAINSLPSSQMKARLVYLRWKNPLPGHRAFTKYAPQDPRIDMARLKKIVGEVPTEEGEQNRVWYRLYKPVSDQAIVSSVHRDFLLMRDFASTTVTLILIMGPISFYTLAEKVVAALFVAILVVEFLFFRQAAANSGVRMVTNVLAIKTAGPLRPITKS